jgi:mRNA interferase MazF
VIRPAVVRRAQIYWCDLGEPRGHAPAKRRPVLVVQSDQFNASRLGTVVVAVITSNVGLASMPGNVFLPQQISGLPADSVVNVTALATVDRSTLDSSPVGQLPAQVMDSVDAGLHLVLAL